MIRTIFLLIVIALCTSGCLEQFSLEQITWEGVLYPKQEAVQSEMPTMEEKSALGYTTDDYRRALETNPNDVAAYQAVKHAYRLKLTQLRDETDIVLEQRQEAKNQGKEELMELQQRWQKLVHQKAQYYLEQADFYLLYQDPNAKIYQNMNLSLTDFPELEAHLRDAYDLAKEIDDGRIATPVPSTTYSEVQTSPAITNPLLMKIIDTRKAITIKYIRTLLDLAQKQETLHSVDLLKEADAQIAKFYRQENPTSEVALLIANNEEPTPEVENLAKQTYQALFDYHCKALEIHHHNRQNYLKIQEVQLAEEELKSMEQLKESFIQLKIQYLWKLQKVPRSDAEKHPELSTVYDAVAPYFTDVPKN